MVCACERWCVTKLWMKDAMWKMVRVCVWNMCVKDGVRVCEWKMVSDKDGVRRRWCVTKLCVKDSVWQSFVWQGLGDKDGVWQSCVWKMVCDKVVLPKWCVTMLCVTRDQSQHSPRGATPATQNAGPCRRQSAAASRATKRTQARHQTQPSVISATPAMQNEGRCRQGPHLRRKTKVL